ncbi:MAG TPA: flavodoxin family protein [Methanocella sp.]|uniref:flavodoxin family protein n=1 Tax=Methanocella sp. TaxID=2052833 RepID=UPI002BC49EEC|nr:flavodoxin family protein [Methanocella sp.]HTY89942.1 flavodoxin family protein [Methanocella sp.]
MKTIIVCESESHGNTLRVAKAMAEVLNAPVVSAGEFDASRAGEYDLIGLGSGIYRGKHHKKIIELAESLPDSDRSIFIFSTSGKGDINQHKLLSSIISRKGYRNAGEFLCKGWDTDGLFKYMGGINRGLPNDTMLEQARDFAKTLRV